MASVKGSKASGSMAGLSEQLQGIVAAQEKMQEALSGLAQSFADHIQVVIAQLDMLAEAVSGEEEEPVSTTLDSGVGRPADRVKPL